jgi:hypothetical protein
MTGHPHRNLSVRCAVGQSKKGICENSQRASPIAIASATLVTAQVLSQHSKIMRGRHDVVEAQSVDSGCRASPFPVRRAAVKPQGSTVADNLDLRPCPRPKTLASRVTEFPFFARFAVINLVGVALLAAAWAEGLLLKPYRADASGMCYLITVLFLVGAPLSLTQ